MTWDFRSRAGAATKKPAAPRRSVPQSGGGQLVAVQLLSRLRRARQPGPRLLVHAPALSSLPVARRVALRAQSAIMVKRRPSEKHYPRSERTTRTPFGETRCIGRDASKLRLKTSNGKTQTFATMNMEDHSRFSPTIGNGYDISSADANVTPPEMEQREREMDLSFPENGMHHIKGTIKMEDEGMADAADAIFPREERDGGGEEPTGEGYHAHGTDDSNDEDDGEGADDGPSGDLSPFRYPAYESEAAAADGRAGLPRAHSLGKLNCDICGLSCVSINVLLVHKRSHTGERPFHCSQCGASFTQKGNLLRHIKLHSGEKPFKCPMCSYACRRRDALSGHLRTHSVEKPFKCNLCSRSYKQRSSLEEHRERCHVYPDGHATAEEGDNGVCLDLSLNGNPLHRRDPPSVSPGPDVRRPFPPPGAESRLAPPRGPYPVPPGRHQVAPVGHGAPAVPRPLRPAPGADAFPDEGSRLTVPREPGRSAGGPERPDGIPRPRSLGWSPAEGARVWRGEAEAGHPPGPLFPCGHCKVIFLDYVMFTIHMGCHGFRDPLECNVCGHRSRDRYEFSSHIVRGEHRLEAK
ncbi:zinc finger protein Aiolos-like isoform X2 [Stigmatopora argus]